MLGKTLSQRYKIKSELGQGGMGTVYRAHDNTLHRDVAVKLMSNTKLGTEGRARLLREAQTIAQLNHPNIVTVYDAGEYESFPYIIMELVEGGTLKDHQPSGFKNIVDVARQICLALEHAHDHDIIHRDLKPENIAIDPEGNVRLMDFGLARSVATRLTTEGGIIGTVYYMAPEQAMGRELDARADLYALGVILYELTTGALPFEDQDPIAVISQHIYAPPIAARAKNAEIPPLLNDLIMRLLSKEREDRPGSAQDIIAILDDPAILDTQASPAEELSLLDRIVRGRIIGRKAEFEEARTLWNKTMSGQGQLLLISGEPGVGKTRLMREIATHADVSGGNVLIGESFAQGNSPYGAFGQIVHTVLEPSSSLEVKISDFVLADLLTITPELRQFHPDIPTNPKLEPDAERQRLFENVASFLASLAEIAPVLLVIDDAHWSDSGTLLLLRHLARRTNNLPIMLIATYREIELIGTLPLNEMLRELNRQRVGTRIKLSRLDLDNTRNLLESIFAEDISEEFAKVIYRETEGNPFFVEEVCKSLVEQGILYFEDGEWHRPEMDAIEIPQSVQVAIEARLENIDKEFIDILRLAAALGREFEYNTLIRASKSPEEQVVNALETAEEAQLLSETSRKAGGIFTFAHALIPVALTSGLSGLRQRQLHRQTLAAEEELHPQEYASLAHHAAEAGDVEKTLDYAQKAGQAAAALYAWEEAQFQFQRAIEAAAELDQPEKLSMLHELAGLAYNSQGIKNSAIENLQSAIDFANENSRIAEIKSYLGNVYISIGDERALPLLEWARKQLDPKSQAAPLAYSLMGIGRHHHLHGHHQKALKAFREAQKIADTVEDPNLQGSIYTLNAGAYQHLARFDESDQWAKKSIKHGQLNQIPSFEAFGLEYLGENATATGRWQDSLDYGNQEMQIALNIGDQDRIGWVYFYTLIGYHGLGELSKAAELAEIAFNIIETSGDKRLESLISSYYIHVLCDQGRYEKAHEVALNALQLGQQLGQIFMLGFCQVGMVYYHIRLEEWAQALDLLNTVVKSLEGTDSRWLPIFSQPLHAEALWGNGDLDQAAKLAQESYTRAKVSKVIYVQADTLRIMAQVLYSQEKYDDALKNISDAIELAQQENYRIGLGRTLYWQAKILHAQDQIKPAKESATQAERIFEEAGAIPDLERTQTLLNSLK